jgi:hypothetical protein
MGCKHEKREQGNSEFKRTYRLEQSEWRQELQIHDAYAAMHMSRKKRMMG